MYLTANIAIVNIVQDGKISCCYGCRSAGVSLQGLGILPRLAQGFGSHFGRLYCKAADRVDSHLGWRLWPG